MTGRRALELEELPGRLAICRLEQGSALPEWALRSPFLSVTRTADELSIVCEEARVPDPVRVERGWRGFRVAGTLDFALTGILASLASPLARAGVSLFAVSTFDTDYVLVREADWERAREVLGAAGHRFRTGRPA
jgi:hypothetical protein